MDRYIANFIMMGPFMKKNERSNDMYTHVGTTYKYYVLKGLRSVNGLTMSYLSTHRDCVVLIQRQHALLHVIYGSANF